MWDLPRSGFEAVSPALAGRFFITKPPGKPLSFSFCPWSHSELARVNYTHLDEPYENVVIVSPTVDSKWHPQVWVPGSSIALSLVLPTHRPLGGRHFSVSMCPQALYLGHHHYLNSIQQGLCELGALDVPPQALIHTLELERFIWHIFTR